MDQYILDREERLVPSGSSSQNVRVFLQDDKIVVGSSNQLLAGEETLRIVRGFSDKELDKIEAPWLKRVLSRVIGRRTCVQRADVHRFQSEILLPKAASDQEKEQIWKSIVQTIKGLGHQVSELDQRTKLRSVG
jgi:hypothetical protein